VAIPTWYDISVVLAVLVSWPGLLDSATTAVTVCSSKPGEADPMAAMQRLQVTFTCEALETGLVGWGGGIRTSASRNQIC
jgi:hypothetical protein